MRRCRTDAVYRALRSSGKQNLAAKPWTAFLPGTANRRQAKSTTDSLNFHRKLKSNAMSTGWLRGVVKEVVDGGTLVVMGNVSSGPPPEKRIVLSSLVAPRMVTPGPHRAHKLPISLRSPAVDGLSDPSLACRHEEMARMKHLPGLRESFCARRPLARSAP